MESVELINDGPLARVQISVCALINLTIVNEQTGDEKVNKNLEVCFDKKRCSISSRPR